VSGRVEKYRRANKQEEMNKLENRISLKGLKKLEKFKRLTGGREDCYD
jgi:hypothetical protein